MKNSHDDSDGLLYRTHKLYASSHRQSKLAERIEAGLKFIAVWVITAVFVWLCWKAAQP